MSGEHPYDDGGSSVDGSSEPPPAEAAGEALQPTVGTTVAARYRLEAMLGAGGMGSVWIAWDGELERQVALKFMSAAAIASQDLRERFNREAKAAAGLRTRHVVEVYDFGVDDGRPFIVMELLEGEDLRKRLKKRKRLPLFEVASIVSQAARALGRAADAGIVHRDLKPANLFIARADDEEVVKVLDFGVAKRTDSKKGSAATKSGVVLGSPPYMSPEQARGKPLDHRSDLWSLTAITYRAVTGKVPFSGDSDGDIIVKLCTESPPPPSSHLPDLPAAIDAFFEKAFAPEPEDRFQTAAHLSRAFAAAVGMPDPRMSLPDGIWPVRAELGSGPGSGPPTPISVVPRPEEGLLATPLSGVSSPLITPLPVGGTPSGAPGPVHTLESWAQEQHATAPRRSRLVWIVAGVCSLALVVIVAAALSGDGAPSDPAATAPQPAAAEPPTEAPATAAPESEPPPTPIPSVEPTASVPGPSMSRSAEPPTRKTAAHRAAAKSSTRADTGAKSSDPKAAAKKPTWGY